MCAFVLGMRHFVYCECLCVCVWERVKERPCVFVRVRSGHVFEAIGDPAAAYIWIIGCNEGEQFV